MGLGRILRSPKVAPRGATLGFEPEPLRGTSAAPEFFQSIDCGGLHEEHQLGTKRSRSTGLLCVSDLRKLAMTALVRQRTTMSNIWLSEKLSLGHISRVSQATRDSEAVKLAQTSLGTGCMSEFLELTPINDQVPYKKSDQQNE